MQYIEIQPIEKHAEKISKQLDSILKSKPSMYSKTKKKYKHLAYVLLQCVEKISSILEEESLISDTDSIADEFEELSDTTSDSEDLECVLSDVTNKIVNCNQFDSDLNSNESSLSKKDIMSKFLSVLQEASTYRDFQYVDVSICANILWKWIKHRFAPDVKNSNFRYKMSKIPEWISYIIIGYGKYLKENRIQEFQDIFDKWIDDITIDKTNTWSLPYEIFRISKSVEEEDFTMEAVIIGDILMEEVLYKLTQPYMQGSNVYMTCFPVAEIVKTRNINLTSKIKSRLANQDNLITECNFKKIGE